MYFPHGVWPKEKSMMGAGHEPQQISQHFIVEGVSGKVAQTYRRLRQEESFELKVSLGYTVSFTST